MIIADLQTLACLNIHLSNIQLQCGTLCLLALKETILNVHSDTSVHQFKESICVVANKPKVLILRMRHVLTIDASGIHILEEIADEAKDHGYILVFSAVSRKVYRVMRRSGFVEMVGRKHFAGDIFRALEIAQEHLERVDKLH